MLKLSWRWDMKHFMFSLLCVVFLTACSNKEPQITMEVTVSPVSETEYKSIGATQDLIEPRQEDFKHFEFHFTMEHAGSIKERMIDMYAFDNVVHALNEIDGTSRYWYGGWSEQDNETENAATYYQEAIFYAKGLNEHDIKEAFSNEIITVSWVNEKNEKVQQEYKLSHFIQFN